MIEHLVPHPARPPTYWRKLLEHVAKPAVPGIIRPMPASIPTPHPKVAVLRRVVVKGTSGAGKSTFAAAVARRLGVAYVELDALHHGPNWSAPTAEEFRRRVRAALAAAPEGWV